MGRQLPLPWRLKCRPTYLGAPLLAKRPPGPFERLRHDPEKACPGLNPGRKPVLGPDHASWKMTLMLRSDGADYGYGMVNTGPCDLAAAPVAGGRLGLGFVVTGNFVDFFRRHMPGDVAHLLADIITACAGGASPQ